MAIYQQVPIRLQASLVSNPPVTPVDANTGETPKFWRGQNVGVQFGGFDANGYPLTLSNLSYLQLTVWDGEDASFPLITKTVLAADITPQITTQGWAAGLQSNATFSLTKAETDLALGGESSKDFWLVVEGFTTASPSERIVYIAGTVTVYNAGSQLPLPPFGYVSRDEQTLSTGDITVSPTSLDHTEFLTVNGDARTSNVILSVNGITDGAICRLSWALPATADIVFNVKNATVSGTTLTTFTTGPFTIAYHQFCFKEATATWQEIPGLTTFQ